MAYIIRKVIERVRRGIALLFKKHVPQAPAATVHTESPPDASIERRKRSIQNDGDGPESKKRKIDYRETLLQRLIEVAALKKMTLQKKLVQVKNTPLKKKYVVRMKVRCFRSFGVGTTKAAAEERAARIMLEKLWKQEMLEKAGAMTGYAEEITNSAAGRYLIFAWRF
ncbi:hypothetical protein BsWGS_23835 [Bradybaena similaris]